MKLQITCNVELSNDEMTDYIKNNLEKLLQDRLDRWPADVDNYTITVEELF